MKQTTRIRVGTDRPSVYHDRRRFTSEQELLTKGQADWSSSDKEGSIGYVNNRPFYEETLDLEKSTGDIIAEYAMRTAGHSYYQASAFYTTDRDVETGVVEDFIARDYDELNYLSVCINYKVGDKIYSNGATKEDDPDAFVYDPVRKSLYVEIPFEEGTLERGSVAIEYSPDNPHAYNLITLTDPSTDTPESYTAEVVWEFPCSIVHKIPAKYLEKTDQYMDRTNPKGSGAITMNPDLTQDYGENSVSLGYQSTARSECAVAIGEDCDAYGEASVAIGNKAYACSDPNRDGERFSSVSFGEESEASRSGAVAIGHKAYANTERAIIIGEKLKPSGDKQIRMGWGTASNGNQDYSPVAAFGGDTIKNVNFTGTSYNNYKVSISGSYILSQYNQVFTLGDSGKVDVTKATIDDSSTSNTYVENNAFTDACVGAYVSIYRDNVYQASGIVTSVNGKKINYMPWISGAGDTFFMLQAGSTVPFRVDYDGRAKFSGDVYAGSAFNEQYRLVKKSELDALEARVAALERG